MGETLRRLAKAVASVVALIGILAVAQPAQAATAQCNRACLKNTVDKYLAALVAHDPSQVSLAPNVKFVENTVPTHPGDGLWKTASAVQALSKSTCRILSRKRWASWA